MKWAARPGPLVWANGRIYVHLLQSIFFYILRKKPAHIVQQFTRKTTGAPDGLSATGTMSKVDYQNKV